ncbi:hypothetical protein LUZ63_007646 [Rhynchospora breviuscula]|uniref:Mediator of RNA polymerase II transcription subunit 33A n=1 Tax=Rhynchospora breviuscula TaxID=2022672 RepID=A0A9Q0HUM1_9POAL|nr:hypothetical protein LUZ63_007646 [Rhynchospora breviuscula]
MLAPRPPDDSQANSATADLERRVMAVVKASEARRDPPMIRAVEVARCCVSDEKDGRGLLGFPNAELAMILVSNLCSSHNSPSMWKLLDQTMASRLVYPWHVLALLTPRLIPHRRAQPEAYRLYLELMRRYALSSPSVETGLCSQKITNAMHDALQFFDAYRAKRVYFGTTLISFIVNAITALIDSCLEDWCLPFPSKERTMDKGPKSMDLGTKSGSDKKDQLRQTNTFTAFEVVENMSSNKRIQILLRLAHLNMPELFNSLLQRLRFVEAHKLSSKNLTSINHLLDNLFSNIQKVMNSGYKQNERNLLSHIIDTGSVNSPLSLLPGAGKGGCWISIDILLESCMEAKTLMPIAAFELLTESTMTLQKINQASWQETFQALWISALRLVQRDIEPIEGPIPHLETRLSMLLAIIPLSIAPILKEESDKMHAEGTGVASRKQGLVACLQSLGQFSSLLLPPQSVVSAANDAASKAAKFVRDFKAGSSGLGMMDHNDTSTKAVGNLLHLMVEACIARELIDTSAYFWPGYVSPPLASKDQNSMLIQESPWLNFMQGAPLTGSLQSVLIATPAPSVAELEKLNHLALNGSDEERSAASKILCGASLTCGWNIQETVVRMAVKLLSPPMPPDSPGTGDANHYLTHMHMLNAVLSCLCHVDSVHILSVYGMVPEVAAILMPLCEVFGSFPPPPNYRSSIGEEVSVYSVFSFAFLFLLRLYNFYAPAQANTVSGRAGPVRHELNLDYLLLLRNSRIGAGRTTMSGSNSAGSNNPSRDLPVQLVYIDSFPKLRAWYFQNQACVASVLSGLCNRSPVHQTANRILNMICRKMNNSAGIASSSTVTGTGTGTGTTTTTTSSSSISGSSGSASEDAFPRPLLPAWEVLEAIPFVLEALLTACAYGRLSSRDLTIGLRDLVDFFPASLAGIVSYFSAEITRGIWPNVAMNGIDWPSPDKSLHLVEAEVKDVLARAGVHIQNCYPRGMPPMLPLPMAALVSLTITFKIDKSSEYSQGIVGQALETCAEGCAWPSMPIIGALWTQKAPRWHDFIILSCIRSPFVRDKDAIVQLTRSCFKAFLGPSSNDCSSISYPRGVVGLLGQSLANNFDLRPGFLFLRTCRTFHDTHFISELIFKQVLEWTRKMAGEWASSGPARLKSGQASLAAAVSAARQVAILGASLLCVAGRTLLVQVLFEETVPTMLLSSSQERSSHVGSISSILEGYAISYLMVFSSALVWGIRSRTAVYKIGSFERRARLTATHMDFMARVLDGNVILGCDPAMWKAHVSCFVGLVVRFAPAWVQRVKVSALRKLANGLRGWHECELALALLELGGSPAIDAVIESL